MTIEKAIDNATQSAGAAGQLVACACGQLANNHRNIGGILERRCAACAMIAERDDLIEQFGDEYLRLIDKIEGNRMGYRHEIATMGLPPTGYTYDEALELVQQRNRLEPAVSM
jgi:hypothetical protein